MFLIRRPRRREPRVPRREPSAPPLAYNFQIVMWLSRVGKFIALELGQRTRKWIPYHTRNIAQRILATAPNITSAVDKTARHSSTNNFSVFAGATLSGRADVRSSTGATLSCRANSRIVPGSTLSCRTDFRTSTRATLWCRADFRTLTGSTLFCRAFD
jgi:hypothetical protein